jgi:hypothetical protein
MMNAVLVKDGTDTVRITRSPPGLVGVNSRPCRVVDLKDARCSQYIVGCLGSNRLEIIVTQADVMPPLYKLSTHSSASFELVGHHICRF